MNWFFLTSNDYTVVARKSEQQTGQAIMKFSLSCPNDDKNYMYM
jgi:hypothetical protein